MIVVTQFVVYMRYYISESEKSQEKIEIIISNSDNL